MSTYSMVHAMSIFVQFIMHFPFSFLIIHDMPHRKVSKYQIMRVKKEKKKQEKKNTLSATVAGIMP
jgi:hypothetical protein